MDPFTSEQQEHIDRLCAEAAAEATQEVWDRYRYLQWLEREARKLDIYTRYLTTVLKRRAAAAGPEAVRFVESMDSSIDILDKLQYLNDWLNTRPKPPTDERPGGDVMLEAFESRDDAYDSPTYSTGGIG